MIRYINILFLSGSNQVPVLLSFGFHSLVPVFLQNLYIFNVYKQGRRGRTLKSSPSSRAPGGISWKPQQQLILVLRRQPGISPAPHIYCERNEESALRWEKITSRSCSCSSHTVAAGKDQPKSGQCRLAAPG